MLLKELLNGLRYSLSGITEDTGITAPFPDSRLCEKGGLFVCLDGAEEHIPEAIRKGAAVMSSKPVSGVPCVTVRDVRYALSVVYNNYYKDPGKGMRLYGITGTNGKTSVAEFLSSCLRADGRRVGSIGTLGCFADGERIDIPVESGRVMTMTTPDPSYLYRALALLRDKEITDVVMEVSSHAIAQKRVDALRFQTGVFTNLSPEHLDFHKSMEDYFRTKASFVARCETRIVNGDDSDCRRFAAAVPSHCVGMNDAADVFVTAGGVSYRAFDCGRIESAVGGEFTVINTLLAVKAARCAGVPFEKCACGIASVESVRGRVERAVKREDAGFDVMIDYAHTPAALESILSHLRRVCRGRIICVFGCGGERDRSKRPVMGRIAEGLSDGVIVTSDNPRGEDPLEIIRDITDGMKSDRFVVIPDRRKAIIAAVSMAEEGDTVLLAGKGHETYELVGENVGRFDEREVLKEALRLKKTND